MSSQIAEPRAAYVHVPFCRHRCGYCNFTLIAGRDDLIERYLAALELELQLLGSPRTVDTLFFGGGTPTHLPPAQLTRLLQLARSWFVLASGGEFSAEANPLDLTPERMGVLHEAGITRISIGAQSFSPRKLKLLERDHQPADIASAFHAAAQVASSVSLDLIFGVPEETPAEWEADLQQAIALQPQHISTYGLTIEKGTSFFPRVQRGELQPASDDASAGMYERAIDLLTAAGYEHYEVSNFALPSHRCRHNETYWLGRGYFAAGPGAARYVQGVREMNHRSTTTWLQRLEHHESPVAEREEIAAEERARERLVFGLRRLQGISLDDFQAETGFAAESLGGAALQQFIVQGLLQVEGNTLRLTRRGLLISDSLWPYFLRD
ncbi:Oxygen-independent coproporphyrinogen-III oxidase-like protein [Anatilimnocola aggregata]|uniref:Heme chaperone HemW n=1 Tax=Anatilimnocola aggregata TaxID=2528021 RepID=A0A517YMI6_9BACT|nr:radical SAM family heme chaperone HemW [Anatilimnocola aggregata]QDU31438.1 Oxygen-independent coproporphyrinogen-III oxidase-like protein [Anatilimnocola aggregata]